jgi:hypothetical protein
MPRNEITVTAADDCDVGFRCAVARPDSRLNAGTPSQLR